MMIITMTLHPDDISKHLVLFKYFDCSPQTLESQKVVFSLSLYLSESYSARRIHFPRIDSLGLTASICSARGLISSTHCRKSCVHTIETPLTRLKLIVQLIGKGQASKLSSLVTVVNQGKQCMICFILGSEKNRRGCCNRIHVVRD